MSRIGVTDAQAWCEQTKLTISTLDTALLDQVEAQVLTRLGASYDTSTWVNTTSTPVIVKSVLAMLYVSWIYDRTYSEDQEEGNDYAALLRAQAQSLLLGMIDGSIPLPGVAEPGQPAFFPTDASSALCPTTEEPHLGPEKFQMGGLF